MDGKDNLIPMNQRSKDEVRELAAKGGKNSGRTRRKKKLMREWAEQFRDIPITIKDPEGKDIKTTMGGAVVWSQFQAAIIKRNPKSARLLLDLLGETSTNVNITNTTPQVVVSNEVTAEKLQKIINGDD